LDVFSLFGLLASFLVLLIHYQVLQLCFKSSQEEKSTTITKLIWILIGGGALFIIGGFSSWPISIAATVIVGALGLSQYWLKGKGGLYGFVPSILLYSILASFILTDVTTFNEHENRLSIAAKLDRKQNPVTEFLFEELAADIKSDRKLRLALAPGNVDAEAALVILNRLLTYDHWNAYEHHVDIFNANGGLLVSDRERTGNNYFEQQAVYNNAQPTISDELRYVGSWSAQGGYLARLELTSPRGSQNLILFITFIPEKTDDILGFTDLFVDEEYSTARELEGYSYALYQNSELQDRKGGYSYGLTDKAYDAFTEETHYFNKDGYSHMVFRPVDGRLVVVSKPENGLLSYLTTFSYLFLFYLACSVVLALLTGRLTGFTEDRQSFRNRINLAMSSVSLVSLLLIGVLTVVYVIREYNNRNEAMITEKTRSVLIELEHKLRDKKSFEEEDKAMLSALMLKFSKVFFTDINLYHMDGHLLATSRARLFDEGLMASVMDPVAYEEMRFGQRSAFIHEETIGNLNYLTAYVPFRNDKREVIAFMSLPYFARQYGLQQEIFALLATLTNIYVFLILFSVVVALFISNRITEPLRFIRESLKNLKLDQANRAIDWQSNDEIGELVDEYNRTLNELVRSAELLAKSERESAWREMAKQVAHEIKNPLTPMKLSIQMLQRSMADGAVDLNERIERTSKTLIEQIDTLSNIATEFSSFAQMPKSVVEDVDLVEVLQSLTELYRNSEVGVYLQLNDVESANIKADKEQVLRVFTNLVKNGIQAVPEDRQGEIRIDLIGSETEWRVAIIDNGSGIPEELHDKIFVPNFTTKTSGMGLGLAMVKNIIETSNGKIWFETEEGSGTTFYVSFPAG
jgi:signal transduction histidine kinase